jgi:hypothetical protein
MFRWLWEVARRSKEAAEWWAILVAFGLLPSTAVVYGVVTGQPFDVIVLYVMAGIAYMFVVVAEFPILRAVLQGRLGPRAKLVFDSEDQNYIQPGTLSAAGASAGSAPAVFDEYLYALGVVSRASKPVRGCRVVLEAAQPHNTAQQRLGRSMKVRNDPPQGQGEFTLNPGDGRLPSAFVEVLQELVPRGGGQAEIRLRYADMQQAQANWFTDRGGHVLTFRLEGDLPTPVRLRVHLTYDGNAARWRVRAPEQI